MAAAMAALSSRTAAATRASSSLMRCTIASVGSVSMNSVRGLRLSVASEARCERSVDWTSWLDIAIESELSSVIQGNRGMAWIKGCGLGPPPVDDGPRGDAAVEVGAQAVGACQQVDEVGAIVVARRYPGEVLRVELLYLRQEMHAQRRRVEHGPVGDVDLDPAAHRSGVFGEGWHERARTECDTVEVEGTQAVSQGVTVYPRG